MLNISLACKECSLGLGGGSQLTQEYRVEQREGESKPVDRTVSVQVRPHNNEGLDEDNNDDIDKGAESPEEEKEKVEDIRAPLEATEVKVNSEKKINIVPLDLKSRIYDKDLENGVFIRILNISFI